MKMYGLMHKTKKTLLHVTYEEHSYKQYINVAEEDSHYISFRFVDVFCDILHDILWLVNDRKIAEKALSEDTDWHSSEYLHPRHDKVKMSEYEIVDVDVNTTNVNSTHE